MDLTYNNLINDIKNIEKRKDNIYEGKILNTKFKTFGLYNSDFKNIFKKYKDINLNELVLNEYYEINFLYVAYSLMRLKTLEEQFFFLKENISLIDSWALVDGTYQYLKIKDVDDVKIFLQEKEEFLVRYGYVSLLPFTKNKDLTLKILSLFRDDEKYYIQMAEGWVISYLFINDFETTLSYLKNNIFSIKIIKIGIQKGIDSFRLDKDQKTRLKEFRNYINSVK